MGITTGLNVKNKNFVEYTQNRKIANTIFALCGLASNNHGTNAFRSMREDASDIQAHLNKQAFSVLGQTPTKY